MIGSFDSPEAKWQIPQAIVGHPENFVVAVDQYILLSVDDCILDSWKLLCMRLPQKIGYCDGSS